MPDRLLFVSSAIVLVVSCFLALAACDEAPPSGAGGHAGAADGGGGDGGCPVVPQPMFTVTITASNGSVPPDTSLAVTWSAGPEPVFLLNEQDTWRTLDQGANVVCDVDSKNPPPKDLAELVCRLWTNGATEVVVSAEHYQKHTETLIPLQVEQCEGPVPKAVAIQLLPETDAGAAQ